ncbi:MAG: thioredoxin family protein [Bacteroidetes bacterium]|nr:thioredoxin family protein [Bacteroidota bacterium]
MLPKTIIVIAMFSLVSMSCSKSYKWITTDRNEKILVGGIKRKQLNDDKFPWFKKNYDSYNTAANTDILYLKAYNARVTFVVFAGTWCDDTQNLLPKFYRVLDEAQFPESAVVLYGVDRNKKSLKGEADKNVLSKVPTIIVYKDGKEIGKVVESVKSSIEVDLKEMILDSSH